MILLALVCGLVSLAFALFSLERQKTLALQRRLDQERFELRALEAERDHDRALELQSWNRRCRW